MSATDKPWFLKVQTEEWQRANQLYQPFRSYMEQLRKKYSVPDDVRLVLLVVGAEAASGALGI